jgi:hypothetical protein
MSLQQAQRIEGREIASISKRGERWPYWLW